jgi:bacteriophage CI repressor helix-turn-helix domain
MLNTSDFVVRLQTIMDYYGLSASAFADALEIQRSGISHLLSERNKPSLDFILRLVEKFPEVDMYWITQGKGIFPPVKEAEKEPKAAYPIDLFSQELSQSTAQKSVVENKQTIDVVEKEDSDITNIITSVNKSTKVTAPETIKAQGNANTNVNKEIQRIIIFYTNKKFEVFENV